MNTENHSDFAEPPALVKWAMWLFRKRTWKEHPVLASVALIIVVGVAYAAIAPFLPEPDSPETQVLNEYLQACESGSGAACNEAGVLIGDGKGAPASLARSAQLYVRSCELNYGGGCRNAARRFRDGEGVEQDHDLALEFFEKSCALGSESGCEGLVELNTLLDLINE